MTTITAVMDTARKKQDDEEATFITRVAITVGQGQIDGFINLTFPEPFQRLPIVICSTEQTTRFTSHVYNVSTTGCSIVVHRMDQGDAIPQSFFVNVMAL